MKSGLVALLLFAALASSEVEGRRFHDGARGPSRKEAKLGRKELKKSYPRAWFGAVDNADACLGSAEEAGFELHTTDARPTSLCQNGGDTFCICLESGRSAWKRRIEANGGQRPGGRGGRGRGRGRKWGRRWARRNGQQPEEEEEEVNEEEINEVEGGAEEVEVSEFLFKCGECNFVWGKRQNHPFPNELEDEIESGEVA